RSDIAQMVERYIRRHSPRPSPEAARWVESRVSAIDSPERLHGQVLSYPRIPDNPNNPAVRLVLELSKQDLKCFEIASRESLQQFHLASPIGPYSLYAGSVSFFSDFQTRLT